MSRRRNAVPAYRLHKPTKQAVATVYDADGSRRDVYLSRYDSAESKVAYARLCEGLLPGSVAPRTPASRSPRSWSRS